MDENGIIQYTKPKRNHPPHIINKLTLTYLHFVSYCDTITCIPPYNGQAYGQTAHHEVIF
ncbi:hypothetical protein D3C76_109770 [compost metagenome]